VSSRKLTKFIAATTTAVAIAIYAVVAIGIGGSAIGNSSSSSGASGTANAPTAGKVVPFHRGQPGPSKRVGQVPANWRPGTGKIITGTAAEKAKAAAVAAYPGGIVNRVVLLSDGEYNVHIIGVSWPHHVFVSENFKVIGAE
jgi:hypothetical protein